MVSLLTHIYVTQPQLVKGKDVCLSTMAMATTARYNHVHVMCDISSSHLLAMSPYGLCMVLLYAAARSPIQYSKSPQTIITIDVPELAFQGSVYGTRFASKCGGYSVSLMSVVKKPSYMRLCYFKIKQLNTNNFLWMTHLIIEISFHISNLL